MSDLYPEDPSASVLASGGGSYPSEALGGASNSQTDALSYPKPQDEFDPFNGFDSDGEEPLHKEVVREIGECNAGQCPDDSFVDYAGSQPVTEELAVFEQSDDRLQQEFEIQALAVFEQPDDRLQQEFEIQELALELLD